MTHIIFLVSSLEFFLSCSRTCPANKLYLLFCRSWTGLKISDRGMPVLWKRCFRSDTVGHRPPVARPTHNLIHHGTIGEWVLPFCSQRALSQAFNVGWKCAESHVRSRKKRLSKKRIDTQTSCGWSSRVSLDVRSLETIARSFARKNHINIY